MAEKVEIEQVDNGFIVDAPWPHASYRSGRKVFTTLKEVHDFIDVVFRDGG